MVSTHSPAESDSPRATALLDAARELTIAQGWDAVRLNAVAQQAGVSRPMIYKFFGDKVGLGQALVMREAELFLRIVRESLAAHPQDQFRAMENAMLAVLNEGERNPLLRSIVAAEPHVTSLVSTLTTGAEPVLGAARLTVQTWAVQQFPNVPAASLGHATEILIRSTLNMLVSAPQDREPLVQALAEMTLGWIRDQVADGPTH